MYHPIAGRGGQIVPARHVAEPLQHRDFAAEYVGVKGEGLFEPVAEGEIGVEIHSQVPSGGLSVITIQRVPNRSVKAENSGVQNAGSSGWRISPPADSAA